MKFRWTKKALNNATDNEILRSLIVERTHNLNPNALLAQRLKVVLKNIETRIENDNQDIPEGTRLSTIEDCEKCDEKECDLRNCLIEDK